MEVLDQGNVCIMHQRNFRVALQNYCIYASKVHFTRLNVVKYRKRFFFHNAIMYVSNHQILLNKMQDHHYYNIVVVCWKYCPFFHLWFILCSICNFPDLIHSFVHDVHTIFMFVGHIFFVAQFY